MMHHFVARAAAEGRHTWCRLRRGLRRVLPRAVLLMYHRVADEPTDPWKLAVSPTHFAEHAELLSARGDVWPLSAYVQRLHQGIPPRRAIILTFDDGYVDNLTTALPLLDAHGLPATFFVPTGLLGTTESFWWDTLADCLLHRRPLPEKIVLDNPRGGPNAVLRAQGPAVDDRDRRDRLHRDLWTLLSRCAPAERTVLLDQLCTITLTPRDAPPSRRVMSPAEVTALSDHPGMEIGAHTVSHTPLNVLPPHEQREELRQSQQTLQALTGGPVAGLSYPNGAYDATTQGAARDLGFTHACTTAWGATTWTTDPLALPRLHVQNVDASTLDEQLSVLLD